MSSATTQGLGPTGISPRKFEMAPIVLLIAIAVGIWLRLATLTDFALSGDEFWTLKWSRLPIGEILSRYDTGLTMHLYILFMKGWTFLFGVSPLTLKLPSLVAGILLIPLVYAIGRRLVDAPTAALAAMMMAISPPMIESSRTARTYPILTAALLVSMFLFLRALRTGSRRDLLALALANTLALALSLTATYSLVAQGAVVALQFLRPPRPPLQRLLLLVACFATTATLAGLFYLRSLPAIVQTGHTYSASPYLRPDLFLRSFQINHLAMPALMLGLMAAGTWFACRRVGATGQLLVLWSALAPVLYFAQGTVLPDWAIARYLIPTLPAHFLLIALALMTLSRSLLPRRGTQWALVLSTSVILGATLLSTSARTAPFRKGLPTGQALALISQRAQPGDLVTYEFEGFHWLLETQLEIEHSFMRELVRDSRRDGPGRLLVLTRAMPKPEVWRSRGFDVDAVGGPGYQGRLFVLTSEPFSAGDRALNRPLTKFLDGLVEADEQGVRFSVIPHRHYHRLHSAHRFLAQLSRDAGDLEKSKYHWQRFGEVQELMFEARKRIL